MTSPHSGSRRSICPPISSEKQCRPEAEQLDFKFSVLLQNEPERCASLKREAAQKVVDVDVPLGAAEDSGPKGAPQIFSDLAVSPPFRLSNAFDRDGFSLIEVCREGDIAIYRKSKNFKRYGFEVCRIRVRGVRMVDGGEVGGSEFYPSTKRLGVDLWVFSAEGSAREKFDELARARQ